MSEQNGTNAPALAALEAEEIALGSCEEQSEAAKDKALARIRAQVEACRACELCDGRTNVVFGSGNPNAEVFIIGEAPGKNEDKQGVPFVGAAGKYLDELLGYAGLDREDVYIANVLKCRPPSNRNPKAPEILACSDYLRAQVSAVNPRIIVTLGNFAMKFILKTEEGITSLRGSVQFAGRFMVFPVFHPAAAIYDRSKRDALQADFTLLGTLVSNGRSSDAVDAGAVVSDTETYDSAIEDTSNLEGLRNADEKE